MPVIGNNGQPDRGEMDPDLMVAPRPEIQSEKAETPAATALPLRDTKGLEKSPGGSGGKLGTADSHGRLNSAPVPGRSAEGDRLVTTAHLLGGDPRAPDPRGLGIACEDEAACGLAIQPMHRPGPVPEITLHSLDDGDAYPLSGLRGEPRGFIHDDYIFVFIEPGEHVPTVT